MSPHLQTQNSSSDCPVVSPESITPNGGTQASCPVLPRVVDLEAALKSQTRVLSLVVGTVAMVSPYLSAALEKLAGLLGLF